MIKLRLSEAGNSDGILTTVDRELPRLMTILVDDSPESFLNFPESEFCEEFDVSFEDDRATEVFGINRSDASLSDCLRRGVDDCIGTAIIVNMGAPRTARLVSGGFESSLTSTFDVSRI